MTAEYRSNAAGKHYLPSLDGWRAIAIALVLLSHGWASHGAQDAPEYLRFLTLQGNFGVRIFFVISGFLITLLLLKEHAESGSINIRYFYIRRVLRIFPVYFAFLAVLGAASFAGLYEDSLSSWLGSITFTRNMFGQGLSATSHLWSIAVEEQFYILWPMSLVALGLVQNRRRALLVLLAVIVAAFTARLTPCNGNNFVCLRLLSDKSALKYADCLAVGCVMAFWVVGWPRLLPRSQLVFFVPFAALVASALLVASSSVGWSVLVLTQALLTGICLVASITTRPVGIYRFLNNPAIVALGVLSYSLYIWHMLFLSHYMGDKFSDSILHDWRIWPFAALATASVSYLFFEKPITKVRRHFNKRG